MKTLNRIVLSTIFLFTVMAFAISCKKDSNKKYQVTYTFNNSTSGSYLIQIWDVTEKNNISQTVSTSGFSKTIEYDYTATYRCMIENSNSMPSKMSISITYNGVTTTCSDSLFSSIECFRNI